MLFFKRLFSTRQHSPIDQLKSLQQLTLLVNSTASSKEKQCILTRFPSTHDTLKRIYDTRLRHYLSAKKVQEYMRRKPNTKVDTEYDDLNLLLDALSSRTITGNAACDTVAAFYTTYCQEDEAVGNLFWRVIDRNLKMGVAHKTIHQLVTSNPPSFSPALAQSLSKKDAIFDGDWYVSQKLDGIRCLATIKPLDQDYQIQFFSRTGRPFTSLQKVKLDIQKRLNEMRPTEAFVLDGEVCVFDESNENFLKAMGQVRRLNEDMENPKYLVFDFIPSSSFFGGHEKSSIFTERQMRLKEFLGNSALPHLKLVEQIKLSSQEHLNSMELEAASKGWEGLILRKDVSYEGKRSRNMLKIKEWEDAEYIVKSIETGPMRMPDTGEIKCVMTNVNIEHKGYPVSVGSGFSMKSRIDFADDPTKIIGKPITVKYFSESKRDNGAISLRFPLVKAIYDEGKRDV